MHITSKTSRQFEYRLLEDDRIEGHDLATDPDPSRLRAACLMIYAGLLLTLGAMLSSASAAADYRAGSSHSLPLCDQRCQVMEFTSQPFGPSLESGTATKLAQASVPHVESRYLLMVIAGLSIALIVFHRRISEFRRRDIELNTIIEKRTDKLRAMNARLDKLSRTDDLTGIANHRRLRLYLAEQWRACDQVGLPVTLIIMDVDHFKQFNDSMGHQIGDRFLRAMAQSLSRLVAAEGGLLARCGGEEFLAVLPRRTHAEGADLAETLRNAVISLEYSQAGEANGFVTASFGVASLVPGPDLRPEDLIRMADHAIHEAKRGGRDRVCMASHRQNAPVSRAGWH